MITISLAFGNEAGFGMTTKLNMNLKPIYVVTFGLLSLGAMAQAPAPVATPPGIPDSAGMATPQRPDKDKLSVAAGVSYASGVTNDLAARYGLDPKTDIDLAKMIQAFSNVFVGGAGATARDDAGKVMEQQANYQRVQTQEAIKKMTEAAPQTKAASDKFMETIANEAGVTKLASGVVYKVLKQGDGATPALQDSVKVTFKLTLIDGTEVTEVDHRQLAVTPNSLTKGFAQAIQLMKTGSHWIVYVPYEQGFDDKPQFQDARRGYKVPPYSALVFDVELEEVQPHPPAAAAMAPAPNGQPTTPSVTSSSIVRVPSAEDLKKGEQPRVMTQAEVEAAQKEAMQKQATNAPAAH